jgi:polyisoprenoid-binding protein YceI
MKKTTLALTSLALAFGTMTSVYAETVAYQLDPAHTSVILSWDHFGFSHPTATIPDVSGTINFDKENPEKSSVEVIIPVTKLTTQVAKLDEEFKSADYFDIAKYPEATFKSRKVISKGDDKVDIIGDLTLKGISHSVTLHARLNKEGEHPLAKKPAIGFDAMGSLKRSDFKIDKYIPSVSDKIKLRISTEAFAK